MKQSLFLTLALAVFATTFIGLAQADDDRVQPQPRDDCLICVEEVVDAIEFCNANENKTDECLAYSLGAAADCLMCVCDVIDIINDHHEYCEDNHPGDCIHCVEEVQYAVDHCNAENTTTFECLQDSLAATEDCILCVCDIIDIIEGGDGYCISRTLSDDHPSVKEDPELLGNPVIDCAICTADLTEAYSVCQDNGTTTLDCIEQVLVTASDCIVCACELFIDLEGCDPKPDKTTTPPPIGDCQECFELISHAIDVCNDSELPTYYCVEAELAATAECIVCICDVMADIGGLDMTGCDPEAFIQKMKNDFVLPGPRKIRNFKHNSRFH